MTKTDLITKLSVDTGMTRKEAESAVNAMLDGITGALAEGERVQLVGFGTFETKLRPARMGRNPQTMEPTEIPASRSVSFRPGKALKEAVRL